MFSATPSSCAAAAALSVNDELRHAKNAVRRNLLVHIHFRPNHQSSTY